MQQVGSGALFEAPQRTGQRGAGGDHPEVLRAQQLMRQTVVDGEVADPSLDQWALPAQVVEERHRVGAYRRIGDETGLRVAAASGEGRR